VQGKESAMLQQFGEKILEMKDYIPYDDNDIKHMSAQLDHIEDIRNESYEKRMDEFQAQYDADPRSAKEGHDNSLVKRDAEG
jgi:hypothetical protein